MHLFSRCLQTTTTDWLRIHNAGKSIFSRLRPNIKTLKKKSALIVLNAVLVLLVIQKICSTFWVDANTRKL